MYTMMMDMKVYQVICPKCKYTWIPRTGHPKKCPACFKRLAHLKLEAKAVVNG